MTTSAVHSISCNDPVVSCHWLHANLREPDVKILDASWYMPDEQRDPFQEYQVARIPGALFFDIDGITDRTSNLPHMLPSEQGFVAAVSALGIHNKDRVIIYDGKGLFSAARVWWMFRVFGHDKVWVLDGGFPRWRASGYEVESSSSSDGVLKASAASEAVEKVYHGQLMASTEGSSADSSVIVDPKCPLWKYTTKVDKIPGGGGNFIWICNICNNSYKSSYTRVAYHFLKKSGLGIQVCKKLSPTDFSRIQREDEEAREYVKSKQPQSVPLPPSTLSSSSAGTNTFFDKKRKICSGGSKNPIVNAFCLAAREEADSNIARMFYSGGLPFNLARNPYYRQSFTFVANAKNLKGYVPPGYNKLRTSLLQREKANVNHLLEPIRAEWGDHGVSIVSDGWSDSQRRPLINFIAISNAKPVFIKAIDCSGEIKDKHFIANLIKDVIQEIGHEKVVQVVTDNAPNCKAAGALIEAKFPNIFWTPCVVHTLNLALKNICAAKNVESNAVTYGECSWITQIAEDASFIKNFIMNHSMRLSIFNEFVNLKLLSVVETRFASVIVMLKRLKLIKSGLQSMVVSDKWETYRDDDVGKADFVQEKLINNRWWDSISYILDLTGPIYDMLRACDTDRPCLHLVYDMWDSMIEQVKTVIYKHEGKTEDEQSTFFEVVYDILVDRWTKNNTPLHCLAHALNPMHSSEVWINEDPKRVMPHKDAEVADLRAKCFRQYFSDLHERNKLNNEYLMFIGKKGPFGDLEAVYNSSRMDPTGWWTLYGHKTPLLQKIALRIMSQPSSSSCAERNWSTYAFIHSLKRNRLTPQRAEDLVYVHCNLRLLSRASNEYVAGSSKMWDVGGDAFESFEDIGILQFASLSLDEPELGTGVGKCVVQRCR